MFPAVTKTFAAPHISYLVEMIEMLATCWRNFDFNKENIRAEGNGCIVSSIPVNGLGLLAAFSDTGPSKFRENRVILNYDVRELVFGFAPSIIESTLELEKLSS